MKIILAAAILSLSSVAAFAVEPDGAKLSEIIVKIENTADVKYIDEIEWNNRGYYEIKYYMDNGAKVKIKIDPKTGESIRR